MSDRLQYLERLAPAGADPFAEEPEEERQRLLLFRACDEWFALPLALIREVQPLDRITRVPHAPAEVLGIINLRGRPYTVFGVGRCLGLPGGAAAETHFVVLDFGDADLRIGLAAQEIGQVREVPTSSIGPPPLKDAGQDGLCGVFELGPRVVGLLDVARVFGRFVGDWGVKLPPRGSA
jgi:purine-binding chemotaxis protein CheW